MKAVGTVKTSTTGYARIRMTSDGSVTSSGFVLSWAPEPETCSDGIRNQGETETDCGGPCAACPTCSDGIQNQGETETDCGGPQCAACPTCSDGIQNQGETETDCGGPQCAACPTCSDGIQNQGETETDCGGPQCAACPTCTDGIQNQGENETDCGGPQCAACPTCTDGIQNQNETGIDLCGVCPTCDCTLGTYYTAPGGLCAPCAANSYKDWIGPESCIACPASTVAPPGSTSAFQCADNSSIFRDVSLELDGSSVFKVKDSTYVPLSDSWEISVEYRISDRTDLSAVYMSMGGDTPDIATFEAKNFPCTLNGVPGKAESVCCFEDFRAKYTVTSEFNTFASTLDLDEGNAICSSSEGSLVIKGASPATDTEFVGGIATISPPVVSGNRLTATITIPDANLYSISRPGQSGAVTEREIFVGLAEFTSTGTRILDSANQQTSLLLSKNQYGAVSTYGAVDYSFISFVNARAHKILDENNSSKVAYYAAITFVYDEDLVPAGTGLVPDASVVVAGVPDTCTKHSTNSNDLPSDFAAIIAQGCAPGLDSSTEICQGNLQTTANDDRLGRMYIPLDAAIAETGSVEIDFSITVVDGTSDVTTTLNLVLNTADDRFVTWCEETEESVDLTSSVESSLYVGTSAATLDAIKVADMAAGASTAKSLQDGLLTLTLNIADEIAGTEIYIEDVVTVHVNPGSATTMGYIKTNYVNLFDWTLDPASGIASVDIPEALLTACPVTPTSFYGCATRRDVQDRSTATSAYELGSGGASEFMQLVLRSNSASAATLGTEFENKVTSDLGPFTNGYKKAWWILPGYNWGGITGQSVFSLSSEFFMYILFVVDVPGQGRRRMLQQVGNAGSRDSSVNAAMSYDIDAATLTASVLGISEESVTPLRVGMSLKASEACLPTDQLAAVSRSKLSLMLAQISSHVQDVQVVSMRLDQGAVDCSRRSSSQGNAFVFVEAIIVLEEGYFSIDLSELSSLPGILSVEHSGAPLTPLSSNPPAASATSGPAAGGVSVAMLAGVVGAGVFALILFFLGYKAYSRSQRPPAEALVTGTLYADPHGSFTKEHLADKMFAIKVASADKEAVSGQDHQSHNV